ncbi:MAG: hypothetical protein CMP76_07910 [Flavobacterium sp.]|nr:hypothetical protein [Flavobacterium sp.]|tara:strand:+ start:3679 stop:3867 length:189 start_codon:yes stop_codon:yes gene_type:complete
MTIETLISRYERILLEKDDEKQLRQLKKLHSDILFFILQDEIIATDKKQSIDLLTRIAFSIN